MLSYKHFANKLKDAPVKVASGLAFSDFVVLVADHSYIALFTALEQTHCTLVACDSK